MILADTSEPDAIVRLLQQAVPNSDKFPLNQNGVADYFFGNYEGKKLQFGRVQAGELVGDIDSMEDELKRYYDNADETSQIIEGLLSPVKLFMKDGSTKIHSVGVGGRRGGAGVSAPSSRDLGAKIFAYPVKPSGFIEHGHSFTTVRMSELYAWIYRLSQLGVNTYYTNNWEETARFLIAVYRNEQKPPDEHTTFKRIYRPRIYIRSEKDMSKEELEEHRLTKSLLFLSAAYKLGIGEVKAKALAARFCNILDIAIAPISELTETAGIGKAMAEKLQRSLGRSI
jgi:hypothetical protein